MLILVLLLLYLLCSKKELFGDNLLEKFGLSKKTSCCTYRHSPDWWFITGYPNDSTNGIASIAYRNWAEKPDVYRKM